jgi:hypothetical protein
VKYIHLPFKDRMNSKHRETNKFHVGNMKMLIKNNPYAIVPSILVRVDPIFVSSEKYFDKVH